MDDRFVVGFFDLNLRSLKTFVFILFGVKVSRIKTVEDINGLPSSLKGVWIATLLVPDTLVQLKDDDVTRFYCDG